MAASKVEHELYPEHEIAFNQLVAFTLSAASRGHVKFFDTVYRASTVARGPRLARSALDARLKMIAPLLQQDLEMRCPGLQTADARRSPVPDDTGPRLLVGAKKFSLNPRNAKFSPWSLPPGPGSGKRVLPPQVGEPAKIAVGGAEQ